MSVAYVRNRCPHAGDDGRQNRTESVKRKVRVDETVEIIMENKRCVTGAVFLTQVNMSDHRN